MGMEGTSSCLETLRDSLEAEVCGLVILAGVRRCGLLMMMLLLLLLLPWSDRRGEGSSTVVADPARWTGGTSQSQPLRRSGDE